MSIELKVYQGDKLATRGSIDVNRAIAWLVERFTPGGLVNGFSPSVTLIERNRMVLESSYFTVGHIDGIVKVKDFEQFDDYGWRYELTGTPEWYDSHYGVTGVTNDYCAIRNLIWTFARAWGEEYPRELGNVIAQLVALENQPVT